MCESLTKVEELPSGKRVFYIDVSNIPELEVESYMKHFRFALNEPNSYALPVRHVIPVRPPDTHNSIFRLEMYLITLVIFIHVFRLGLALIK